ncbi:hypothetical protein N657DRAFT_534396, partial [Parathielavia appendiculata]
DSKIATEDVLTVQDWQTLVELRNILSNFAALTKKFEGNDPTFPTVIATVFALRENLKKEMARYHDNLGAIVFDGPDISRHELPLNQPSVLEPLVPATPQERPQRQAGVPQRFKDCEIDLPKRRAITQQLQDQATPKDAIHAVVDSEAPDVDVRFIRTGIQFAIAKLDEYYEMLRQAPVYWYAMILQPGDITRWIERNLDEEESSCIISSFKQFFIQEY